MKPGPQSIPRIPATARAPPPCQSFVCTSQASDKNSPLDRPFELAASLRSDPFTHEQFLNQPWGRQRISFQLLASKIRFAMIWPMKFAAAIFVFVLFACFIGWGVVELLKGSPWLLLAAVGVFLGTFVKYGCQSH